MTDLTGKAAIVTGASRGIGAAAARELANAGAAVLLAARTTSDIDKVAAEIREAGGRAETITADVKNYKDVEAMVARCKEAFGRVDILVNNAGVIEPISHLVDSDPEAWVHAAAINYKGVYNGLRAALPEMIAGGGGVVVTVSSGAATSPLEGWSHYCSAKAGALMLTRCADKEVRDKGVRVVGLSPGTVATDMQVKIKASGVNPVAQLEWSDHIPPEWPGKAIVWLCGEDAAEFAGGDVSLREEAIRRRVGLID